MRAAMRGDEPCGLTAGASARRDLRLRLGHDHQPRLQYHRSPVLQRSAPLLSPTPSNPPRVAAAACRTEDRQRGKRGRAMGFRREGGGRRREFGGRIAECAVGRQGQPSNTCKARAGAQTQTHRAARRVWCEPEREREAEGSADVVCVCVCVCVA
eukprot:1733632-Rhodomonas_salina.1